MTTVADQRTADAILAAAAVHPAGEGLAGRDRLLAFLGAEILSAEQAEARAKARERAERRTRWLRTALALTFCAAITAAVVWALP